MGFLPRFRLTPKADSRRPNPIDRSSGTARSLRLRFRCRVLQVGLYLAFELDGEGIAEAVFGLAGGHLDPAFGQAILLDVRLFRAVETDSDLLR